MIARESVNFCGTWKDLFDYMLKEPNIEVKPTEESKVLFEGESLCENSGDPIDKSCVLGIFQLSNKKFIAIKFTYGLMNGSGDFALLWEREFKDNLVELESISKDEYAVALKALEAA